MNRFRLFPLAVLFLAFGGTAPARADTLGCTELATFPATLSSQGVYCLKHSYDVAAAIGPAIAIAANNVTVDCNGNRLRATGGAAIGIYVPTYNNVTIRNCVLSGFATGIDVTGSGIVVEDNAVLRARTAGIQTNGGPNVVRRNFVVGTGGTDTTAFPKGIVTTGAVDVIDNTIAGVVPKAGTGHSGIGVKLGGASAGQVADNRIWGVTGDGGGPPNAISLLDGVYVDMRGNDALSTVGGFGIKCSKVGDAAAVGNWLVGFSAATDSCVSVGNKIY